MDYEQGKSVKVTFTARLRHTDILKAARRVGSQRELARRLDIREVTIGRWINFQSYPHRVSDAFELALLLHVGRTSDELWPVTLKAEIDRRRGLKRRTWAQIEIETVIATDRLIEFESAGMLQIENSHESASRPAELQELHDDIERAFKRLTPRQSEAVRLRYGFDGVLGRTLAEVGEIMGITAFSVQTHLDSAFNRIGRFGTLEGHR
jgi:RNA polymerase sigma factor (sigma-70 family)